MDGCFTLNWTLSLSQQGSCGRQRANAADNPGFDPRVIRELLQDVDQGELVPIGFAGGCGVYNLLNFRNDCNRSSRSV